MTSEEAIVRAELRALVEDYATITDALDYDAWVNLFLPDAEFSSTNPGETEPFLIARGHSELKGVLHHNDVWERIFHFIGNHRCSIEGDRPTGVVYCLAYHLIADSDPRQSFVMLIKYNDEYALTDNGWRFGYRHQDFAWQEYHTVDSKTMSMGRDILSR
jgi:SnoaL-like protein